MQNLRNLFVLLCFMFIFHGVAYETGALQTKLNIPTKNKNGCVLASYSTFEYEKPSDLLGFIVYGFRGIFGKNKRVLIHYNCPPNVDKLLLSQTRVIVKCNLTENNNSCSDSPQTIEVTTLFSDPENDVVTFQYKVSGGRIIGQGAKVIWDFFNAEPGIYTINAGVDDGTGVIGKTITEEVTVIKCPECK